MFKAVLVDDEPLVLEGLRLMIDWRANGFEVVGEARDGEDALALIRSAKPDLVVTDIRMPVMNGLELIREARAAMDDSPRFVVLSGYSDFEYARKAMQYEAMDYLLKPIEPERMETLLGKLRGELEHEGLPLTAPRLPDVRAVELSPHSKLRVILTDGGDENSCRGLLEELAGNDEDGSGKLRFRSIQDGENRFGAVVWGAPQLLDSLLPAFREKLRRTAGRQVQLFLSEWGDNVEQLEALYGQAKEDRDAAYRYPVFQSEEELCRLIEAGDPTSIRGAVDASFVRLNQMNASPEAIRTYALDLLCQLSSRYGIPFPKDAERKRPSLGAESPEIARQITAWREALVELSMKAAAERNRQPRLGGGEPAVAEAARIAQERFRESLKLSDIAREVYLDPAYLSALFKKTMGVSFQSYLHRIRIQEAKKLLRRTDLKIVEIARRTGYRDADDFACRFKEFAGMTPSEYKNTIGRGGAEHALP
ncbi:response regulator [Cohnella sp. AR92]|uniref:response regulator n=1 Tax=Cohnella sp. AR92 TaxID=648716 RepID=UPI001315101E|nr:response regulator [Cohnella sp. AR92]